VDVVTEANNHGMDYGRVGLLDSLDAAAAKRFPVVGVGHNAAEAFAPWRTTVKGQRLAFIGATQVLDDQFMSSWAAGPDKPGLASAYHVEELLASVRKARATSDTVVVYLHWGQEQNTCPIPRQRTLARQLVDAGADVIVGAHAHRVLGGGRLDNAVVDYGLGNFVFYTRGGPGTTSGVLTVTVTGRQVNAYVWSPARISGGVARPLGGTDAASSLAAWHRLRACTGLTP
jgi:poly-gamma-glutamate synthesis protein (capsule biosynthesis protein)